MIWFLNLPTLYKKNPHAIISKTTHFQINEAQACTQCPALYDQHAGETMDVSHGPWDCTGGNVCLFEGTSQYSSCRLQIHFKYCHAWKFWRCINFSKKVCLLKSFLFFYACAHEGNEKVTIENLYDKFWHVDNTPDYA